MMDNGAVKKCVDKLLSRREPGLLVPKVLWNEELQRQILQLDPAKDPISLALKSALLLWNDDLDGCHAIAQDLDDAHGAYLHGIMHRREPDYGNSKYWFRRVGSHALFLALRPAALELLSEAPETHPFRKALDESQDWDAFRMVDWCESASDPSQIAFLRALQAIEIQGLTYYWMDQRFRRS
ncbi:MAG TPA: hypothetical protein VKW04_10550 [Planctomycetota bacterium]|nr:hypothetical protein [Planctomycetota bacterium]